MKAHLLCALSVGTILAAACGGSSTSSNTTGDGGLSDSSSSGGSGSGSSSGAGSSGGNQDAMPGGEGGAAACQCAAPEQCCVTGVGGRGGMGRSFSCAAANACPAGALAVACSGTQSCGAGQQCCYLPSANAPSMTNVSACMATCPAGARETCATDADCPAGSRCQQQSGGVYGFMTCHLPPPCMGTTDCATGQVCCTSAGGDPNVCQTGTACSAGSTQVCAASADCATGMVCCEGGGQTCQVASACGMPGNREICATSTHCPLDFPICRNMTCRATADGGAPSDSGTPADAPTGG
jgi:hypothetical protein